MKKKSLFLQYLISVAITLSVMSCNHKIYTNNYLKKVLENLEQVKSATYNETTESWAPGDTSASGIYYHYIKEYDNTSDSTIGASYVSLLQKDTTQMTFCYDGNMRAIVYDDEKTIVIDSFNSRKLSFRPLSPPFFNYSKNILRYALETKDSISTDLTDYGDSVNLSITIYEDNQVEFFGKAHYIENNSNYFGETTSRYELWINKLTNLPYRVRREMSHDITVTTCQNVKLNKIKIEDFNASEYFNPEYEIQTYGRSIRNANIDVLIGKIGPDWTLKDADNNTIALKALKSKVLMIQFTSVSCGACLASIPFLNKLGKKFNSKDFDFVAIESFTKNSNVLKRYQERNGISYKFLMSTREVTKSYQIQAVPVFFILDKNRVIRKVIRGYGTETTDREIIDAINRLI